MSGVIHFADLLTGFEFPGTKEEIIQYAQDQGASEEALELLQAMPMEYFDSMDDFNRNALLIENLPGDNSDIVEDMR